jgi:hypothetical protein
MRTARMKVPATHRSKKGLASWSFIPMATASSGALKITTRESGVIRLCPAQ